MVLKPLAGVVYVVLAAAALGGNSGLGEDLGAAVAGVLPSLQIMLVVEILVIMLSVNKRVAAVSSPDS